MKHFGSREDEEAALEQEEVVDPLEIALNMRDFLSELHVADTAHGDLD